MVAGETDGGFCLNWWRRMFFLAVAVVLALVAFHVHAWEVETAVGYEEATGGFPVSLFPLLAAIMNFAAAFAGPDNDGGA